MAVEERKPAHIWKWEHDGDLSRARLEVVLGGEVIRQYPWSKWVKYPTKIEEGYWKEKRT